MATKMVRLVTIGAVAAATAVGSPAWAHDGGHERHGTPRFDVINQVSDQALKQDARRPPFVDPNAVNTWGLALGPDTPLWVANNGTDTATVYSGGVDGAPVDKVNITVNVPGGPTGAVFNDTDGFAVPNGGGNAPARFIFVTEGGDVIAWNQNAGANGVVVAHGAEGAVYKGATLLHTDSGNFLLAADFHNARIDVFDEHFDKVELSDRRFQDEELPEGFAPFNVFAVGEAVYVSYAKQDAAAHDDVPGVGLGFVNLFTDFGRRVCRVASRGTLNAPWGMAIAPKSFGRFAGDLLVGNFGDGKINVFDGNEFEGLLRDDDGDVITIDGLWALLPGTEQTGGEGTLWFSSGPDNEQHGLVGQLIRAN
ncbi:TIGR03118 family protein [Micromonospora narathiwatensis]|uniref:TIGR03118 family protein n=1 Tax=Micromonospora narathiwatensis TaxID=299146 RepID=A0A1A8Z2K0_9ACTN|nr:TIGR03118 family protein [Micromonospora narathiwatensis]SBT38100.1 TIGR03118 family protein [Micromonospora narathiwatensis]